MRIPVRWRRALSTPAASAAAVVVLLIAALGLGRVVTDELSHEQGSAASFDVRGSVSGGTVSLDYVDVTVTGVRATETLVSSREPETTTATFLVVDMELVAPQRSLLMAGIRLRGNDGLLYQATMPNRTGCSASASLPAGVRTYWMACFEIPDDAVEGATLLLGRGNPDTGLDRREEKAVIDLEIDAEGALRLLAADEPLPASLPDIFPYDTAPAEVGE